MSTGIRHSASPQARVIATKAMSTVTGRRNANRMSRMIRDGSSVNPGGRSVGPAVVVAALGVHKLHPNPGPWGINATPIGQKALTGPCHFSFPAGLAARYRLWRNMGLTAKFW